MGATPIGDLSYMCQPRFWVMFLEVRPGYGPSLCGYLLQVWVDVSNLLLLLATLKRSRERGGLHPTNYTQKGLFTTLVEIPPWLWGYVSNFCLCQRPYLDSQRHVYQIAYGKCSLL